MREHPFALNFGGRDHGALASELALASRSMGPSSLRSAALMVQLFGVQLGLALERGVRPEEAVRYLRNAADYLRRLEDLGYEVRLVKSGDQVGRVHNREQGAAS